jgi:hypothetical protein
MNPNSLSANNGLSLSQAQSISNLCNQRAAEIANKFSVVNNYSKIVTVDGQYYETVKGSKLPEDVVDLLTEKAKLHACQAFLMENIKAKEALLNQAKREAADISKVEFPKNYEYIDPKVIQQVDENWGWAQLTKAEYNEYLEADAFAAHIGQFIHKGSVLDTLRAELPTLPAIEWMTIKGDGTKSPVTIKVHHTSEELLMVHENLANLHRGYEQRVNYYKAKVKNLVTQENARIAKLNADEQNEATKVNNDRQNEYETAHKKATEEIRNIRAEFEKERQSLIKSIASMRIEVDPRFQETINLFLPNIKETE